MVCGLYASATTDKNEPLFNIQAQEAHWTASLVGQYLQLSFFRRKAQHSELREF